MVAGGGGGGGGGDHWSLRVPPTMHHGRQGVTRAPPLALVWPATVHSLSAPFAPPKMLLKRFGQ